MASMGVMRFDFSMLSFRSLLPSFVVPRPAQPTFSFKEVMIPVRDGVHLQTAIITPTNQSKPLPILLKRTPYGVPDRAWDQVSPTDRELMKDGYIMVFQSLRGRFKSEGVFKLSSAVNLADPKDTNETTDAYDTIDWLVKNVPNNNGRDRKSTR